MDTTRRQILQALGVTIASTPLAPLVPGSDSAAEAQTCVVTATETIGPYPNHTAFNRQDIREGRPGLPLQVSLTIVNTAASCAPLVGASVETWQCDATGYYSEYSQPRYDGTGATYLRGMQVSDANGQVTFTTIYPGWYQGRVTHIHVKVSYGGQAVKNVATVVFLLESGTPVTKTFELEPTSRQTVYAGLISELVNSSIGIHVTFSEPGVAERAMYFGSTAARLWSGGHESAGVNLPSKNWFLAEGAIGTFFDTFILLSNPNAFDVTATLTFLLENGATITTTETIAASGRKTVNIEQVAGMPAGASVATTVNATGPIVAERSMYWPDGGWIEAHNSFGVTELGTKWGFAEGRVGGATACQTYILLANPGSSVANVTITYLREGSAPIVSTHNVAATTRLTVSPAEHGLVDENFGALVTSTASIAAERALYWTSGGVFWAAGTNATATRLP